jgi:hypothetical protein
MTLTAYQHRTLLDVQERLVQAGVHPAVAGKAIMRAASRVLARLDAGVGKVHQERRLRREEYGLGPRPVVAGGRCRHIQERPGNEEAALKEINDLQQQGWNVMEVEASKGWPRLRTWYACPPGQMPGEAQQLVLQSEQWGGPLYVRSEF